jgi:O-antigen/teichoic acid export membrane protein
VWLGVKRASGLLTLFWSGVLQWARVGVNAVVFLLLSRWLTLSEIGAVAAAQAPVLILQAILTATIPDFVVQEVGLDRRRLSTLFWLSMAVGAGSVLLLIAAAPVIVAGIDDPHAAKFLYALSLCPFFWCLSSVASCLQV